MITFHTLGQSQSSGVEWPSAIVAVAIIALVGYLMGMAHKKNGMDGAAKMWALLGTIVGLLTGTMATYFFTRSVVSTANQQTQTASTLVSLANKTADTATAQTNELKLQVKDQDELLKKVQLDVTAKENLLRQFFNSQQLNNTQVEQFMIKPDLMRELSETRIHVRDSVLTPG